MKDRGRAGFARRDLMRLDDRRRLAVAAALAFAVDAFVLAALVGLVAGGSEAAVRSAERTWLSVELDPARSAVPEDPGMKAAGTAFAEAVSPSHPDATAPRRSAPNADVGDAPPAPQLDALALSPGPGGVSGATATVPSGAGEAEPAKSESPGRAAGTEPDAGLFSSREDLLARLDEAIDRRLSYPPRARERGIEGRVVLKIGVDEVGSLMTCAVDTSSGSAMLDVAARRLVIDIFPLPARLASPFNALVAIEYRLR